MILIPLYPLPFEPFLRPMPWGGRRLPDLVGVPAPDDAPIGEAWLLSDHALHASRVSDGPLAGRTLRELMAERSEELLGYRADRFPLLIKLLDARENLSVQVHPDDAAAARWAPKEGGKTEAWLVLDAIPEATIYLGLKPGIDKATLKRELTLGTVPLCLQRYQPKAGECYFVSAGAIHALGGGLLVLEVQQTSDATFRLYDWGRVDAEGRPRPLHLEAGLACVKEQPPGAGPQKPEPIPGGVRMVGCEFFQIEQATVDDRGLRMDGPCIAIGLRGTALLRHGSMELPLRSGRSVLVPPGINAELCGHGHIVRVRIPPR